MTLWTLVLCVYFGATSWIGPAMALFGGLAIASYLVTYVDSELFAFSLVELGLIIAIIALLLALFPPLVEASRTRLDNRNGVGFLFAATTSPFR